MQRQYLKLEKIDGPLIVLKGVDNVSYDEREKKSQGC